MEKHYQKEKYQNEAREKNLKNLNSHLPDWVMRFVELYTSDLKYEIVDKDSN